VPARRIWAALPLLALRGAAIVQPLSDAQIASYLAAGGALLDGVRALIADDPALAYSTESDTPTLALTHVALPTRTLRRPSLREQAARQATCDRHLARDQTGQTFHQQGHAILPIATRLQMSRVVDGGALLIPN
jgi:hypothetical protein